MTQLLSNQACLPDLARLFPHKSKWVLVDDIPSSFKLHIDEEVLSSKMASKRLSDFKASRYCAKQVLLKLGIKEFPVLINQHRAPIWPKNIVGSLSHCKKRCLAVIAKSGEIKAIGLDVETNKPIDQEQAALICTRIDIEQFKHYPNPYIAAKIIFSVKESIFKCLHPLYRKWIDFKDVDVLLDMQSQSYTARPNCELQEFFGFNLIDGQWISDKQHVYTSCWLK